MRWLLWTPHIIEAADGTTKEQLITELTNQGLIHGAADMFTLVALDEQQEQVQISDLENAANENENK